MIFSEKLFELRKQKGLSQEELSFKLNVARQTISKWESGITTPDMENLIKISKLFEVSIDELVGNENDINKQVSELNNNNIKNENSLDSNIIKVKKKNKVIKILVLYLLILMIGSLIVFSCIVFRRYKMIGYFENAINDMVNKKEYGYWYAGSLYENFNIITSFYDDYIVKDDILIITKTRYDYDKNVVGGPVGRLTGIEYRNKDVFYDIDVENKKYTIKEYNKGKDGFYYFTGINMESEICKEFEFYDNKTKLKLALDFDVIIKEHTNPDNFVWYEMKREEKEDSKIIERVELMTTYMGNKPGLRFSKIEYTDNINQKSFTYEFGEDKFEEEKIKLPDLTEYTLVENIE